jgi:chaperone modulatory protein CbpM
MRRTALTTLTSLTTGSTVTRYTGAVVLAEVAPPFSLAALCQASGARRAQVLALVAEGLLQPEGAQPEDWRFDSAALPRTRRALRLARDLALALSAVALVIDLLDEIERLRGRLQRG